MSRSLTAGSNDPTPMNRRNPQGEIFQLLPHPQEYAVPPRGLYGRFQLTGISDTFELVSAQYGPSTKVRLEFLIVKVSDAGSKYLEGKRFTELYTWTVGPKSNLGQLFGALRGKPIQPGEDVDPDDYIDTSFVTSTTLQISADGQKQYPASAGTPSPVTRPCCPSTWTRRSSRSWSRLAAWMTTTLRTPSHR